MVGPHALALDDQEEPDPPADTCPLSSAMRSSMLAGTALSQVVASDSPIGVDRDAASPKERESALCTLPMPRPSAMPSGYALQEDGPLAPEAEPRTAWFASARY
jgi:hypothetical protein